MIRNRKGWSNTTIKKAIIVKQKGGKNFLDFIRNIVALLPSARMLQQRLEKLEFEPGVLKQNIQSIANDTSEFHPSQKRFLILYDEKAIISGLQQNNSSGKIFGYTTLPCSKEKAVNAMVFLVAGIELRLKKIIAYHLVGHRKFILIFSMHFHWVGKSIDSKLLHEFLLECFCDGFVLDLGLFPGWDFLNKFWLYIIFLIAGSFFLIIFQFLL